jgi:hypothetical protein
MFIKVMILYLVGSYHPVSVIYAELETISK